MPGCMQVVVDVKNKDHLLVIFSVNSGRKSNYLPDSYHVARLQGKKLRNHSRDS